MTHSPRVVPSAARVKVGAMARRVVGIKSVDVKGVKVEVADDGNRSSVMSVSADFDVDGVAAEIADRACDRNLACESQ